MADTVAMNRSSRDKASSASSKDNSDTKDLVTEAKMAPLKSLHVIVYHPKKMSSALSRGASNRAGFRPMTGRGSRPAFRVNIPSL